MAKKKKRIVHIGYQDNFEKPICGQPNTLPFRVINIPKEIGVRQTQRTKLLNRDERICHKCIHIHKIELEKIKLIEKLKEKTENGTAIIPKGEAWIE